LTVASLNLPPPSLLVGVQFKEKFDNFWEQVLGPCWERVLGTAACLTLVRLFRARKTLPKVYSEAEVPISVKPIGGGEGTAPPLEAHAAGSYSAPEGLVSLAPAWDHPAPTAAVADMAGTGGKGPGAVLGGEDTRNPLAPPTPR
jgi:hypothetical protein